MASQPKRSAGAHESSVVMPLVDHATSLYYTDGERRESSIDPNISYFPDGQNIMIGSHDKIARLWHLRAGKEIEERGLFVSRK